jgi:serine/threonine protein phosphatase PrpC
MDGHGVNGHFASDHVKQFLPTNIELLDHMLMMQKHKEKEKSDEEKKNANSGFFDDDEEDLSSYLLSKDHKKKYTVISEGFIKTACDIQQRSFNVDFSGTTVVTVMLTGNKLTCANCGDSRAVLGSLRSKEDAEIVRKNTSEIKMETVAGPNSSGDQVWIATSLSLDHKPDRADEFERIMQSDGRVDPFREENGDPVGPARVWLKTQNIPGLAMSRSIGDLVAASVGVIPEPEFFELVLNESDKFMVIASDGVWEFIDNDE